MFRSALNGFQFVPLGSVVACKMARDDRLAIDPTGHEIEGADRTELPCVLALKSSRIHSRRVAFPTRMIAAHKLSFAWPFLLKLLLGSLSVHPSSKA